MGRPVPCQISEKCVLNDLRGRIGDARNGLIQARKYGRFREGSIKAPDSRVPPSWAGVCGLPAPPTTHWLPTHVLPLRRTAALAALALATAVGLAASTPAQAQRPTTFPTAAAAIKRIWQIGMDSSRVEALGQALLDSIGPRLTGSPGMLAWSPGTKGQPVKAEAIILPKFRDSTEFVAWLPKARGKIVMLSPHFDSWDGSSGATDNGTGTLMAMEAMRILKKAYPNPKRTIMVGHWASEEQGLNGSTAFTEDHPEVMKGLQGLFNQDRGTARLITVIWRAVLRFDGHSRGSGETAQLHERLAMC